MAKKIILFLFVSVLFVSGAFAGWKTIATGVNENLNAVYFVDENTGYAAGDSGKVVKITNGGANYSAKTVLATTNFRDVVAPSSTEVYLVGDNGAFYKTTDYGANYTQQTLPVEIATATIECGSFSGTRRAFAAWTGSAGYLCYSTDSGATFTASEINKFEIYGVALTSTATWEWGRIMTTNEYAILKDMTIVWKSASQKVNDIFFLPSGAAFAVGDSGLMLSKSSDSDSWSTVTTGLNKHLNSCSFISASIGWVAADDGKIYFTQNGGTSFYEYPDSNSNLGTTKLRDIFIYLVGTVAHAFTVGDSGKMFKLASPTISAVSPNSRKQGWVGTIEVTGSEFLNPLTVEITGEGISVYTATAETTAKISSIIVISPTAAISTRDVEVTNPDLTNVTSTAAFAVTANTGNVTVEGTRFDGNIPVVIPLDPQAKNITPTPTISFEVRSSANPLSAATMNAKVLFYQSGSYSKIYFIPASAVTIKTADSANVNWTIPATDPLPSGAATVELYAEDSVGNPGRRGVTVEVVPGADSGSKPKYATGDNTAVAIAQNPIWDMTGPTTIQVQVQGNYSQGVGVLINTGFQGDIAYNRVFPKPITAMSGVASKVDVTINPTDIPAVHRRACLALITIYNPALGNAVTGHGKTMFLPKAQW